MAPDATTNGTPENSTATTGTGSSASTVSVSGGAVPPPGEVVSSAPPLSPPPPAPNAPGTLERALLGDRLKTTIEALGAHTAQIGELRTGQTMLGKSLGSLRDRVEVVRTDLESRLAGLETGHRALVEAIQPAAVSKLADLSGIEARVSALEHPVEAPAGVGFVEDLGKRVETLEQTHSSLSTAHADLSAQLTSLEGANHTRDELLNGFGRAITDLRQLVTAPKATTPTGAPVPAGPGGASGTSVTAVAGPPANLEARLSAIEADLKDHVHGWEGDPLEPRVAALEASTKGDPSAEALALLTLAKSAVAEVEAKKTELAALIAEYGPQLKWVKDRFGGSA